MAITVQEMHPARKIICANLHCSVLSESQFTQEQGFLGAIHTAAYVVRLPALKILPTISVFDT